MEKNSNSTMPLIAAAVVFVGLAAIGLFLIWPQLDNDSEATTATSAAAVAVSETTDRVPVAGLEGLKRVPEDATSCPSTFGSPDVTSSAVASPATSCEFAEEVRGSYLKQPMRYGLVTVDARNPAMGRTQTMKCSGSPVVTCVGGDDDVVYLN